MTTHQIVLLVDDDPITTEGMAGALARSNRTIITCNDIEGSELVVEWLNPSHVVSDVRMTGVFAYEGLDFLRFVKRHSVDTRVILMTGDGHAALEREASERGAAGFLRKPFGTDELDALLDSVVPQRAANPDWPEIMAIPTLDQILTGNTLSAAFQPIVRLSSATPIGYEALARNAGHSLLCNPEALFQYAARKHRIADLEMACVANSLGDAAQLPAGALVFLNIHPSVFGAGRRLLESITLQSGRAGIALNRIVLEITEQESLIGDATMLENIRELKAAGCRFAFDDVGVAFSHLPFLEIVRPSFLKISQLFGTAFESDPTKLKIIRNIFALATDFGSELILEGIETSATAESARALGIQNGQGYHFARPAPASSFTRDRIDDTNTRLKSAALEGADEPAGALPKSIA